MDHREGRGGSAQGVRGGEPHADRGDGLVRGARAGRGPMVAATQANSWDNGDAANMTRIAGNSRCYPPNCCNIGTASPSSLEPVRSFYV